MLKIEIDLTKIRNEVSQLQYELQDTHTMQDTQRRDAVSRALEKIRSLRTMLEVGLVETSVK